MLGPAAAGKSPLVIAQESTTLPADLATASRTFGSGAGAGITVVDVIPNSQSTETDQNSEPSIAVNPNAPNQAVIGVFSGTPGDSPFYSTKDGGMTWNPFAQLTSFDSTLSWSTSGTLYMGRTSDLQFVASLITQAKQEVDKSTSLETSGTPFIPIPDSIYTTPPGAPIPDQPRVAAAQVGGKDHIYLGYNNFTPFNDPTPPTGNTATVQFSTDGGKTWTTTVVDQGNKNGFADGPAVQTAVNGDRVYVAFERGTTTPDFSQGLAQGQVVVVRDDKAGNGGFNKLGARGTTVATTVAPISTPPPLVGQSPGGQSLGHERIGSDLTLAVDPHNADHLYVGYADVPSLHGVIQVHVQESTDGGQTWAEKFATKATPNFKSALPYLAIADNGAVGLLYTAQDIDNEGASFLETHFVQTGNDFATLPTDTLLSRFADGNPPSTGDPYIGDYEGLKAVGDTFYGTFAASNQADGRHAIFPGGVAFQRDFTGTPGTSNFRLTDGSGHHVDFSIDPYYFQIQASSGGD